MYKPAMIQVLFEIAKADNELLDIEIETIRDLTKRIGLSISQFDSIRSMYVVSGRANDFKILEIKSTAADTEVKAAYRKLVKQYHPDKVSHLGKEFRELAEKKFKEINQAYERIKSERGFR
jgi:DnaJ like chaperone protein